MFVKPSKNYSIIDKNTNKQNHMFTSDDTKGCQQLLNKKCGNSSKFCISEKYVLNKSEEHKKKLSINI